MELTVQEILNSWIRENNRRVRRENRLLLAKVQATRIEKGIEVGVRVKFTQRDGTVTTGEVVRLRPSRAHVRADDGRGWKVGYGLLTVAPAKKAAKARKRGR